MFKLLGKFKKEDWAFTVLTIVLIVVQVWFDLKLPDYMKVVTSLVKTKQSTMNAILIAGGNMLLCALGSLLAQVATAICVSKIASNFSANLRGELFGKVQSFSMQEIGNFSTASLITRTTNDVTQVMMIIVMGLEVIVKAPIKALWAVFKIANTNWYWTYATLIAVGALVVIMLTCLSLATPKFKKLQKLTDNLNRVTRENLTGLRVVRAYNAEEYQEEKFEGANDELCRTHLFGTRVMSFMHPGTSLVNNGLTLAVYWIGAILISNAVNMADKLNLFSDMVVFVSYAMQVVMSFMSLIFVGNMLPRALVSAKRVNGVLDVKASIKDGEVSEIPEEHRGEIEFKNVSFKYPDAEDYVLENVSFSVRKGEKVAIIGATGCGKSTVVNLIPRFYDVTEGEVLVGGINVRNYAQKTLRNGIGYVSQRAILFSGTILSNVNYGSNGKDDADMADVISAVATAQATDFVEERVNKYEEYVAQGGMNLSGGQRQRISIARAVCRKPDIFIFDDSFSALDYKTDKALRRALDEKCKGATHVIVAQRIGTIRDADKIIVLDEGKVAGIGRHDQLMKNCEVYQNIALSQLSKEELA
ncbi:MAG: ABC transporter ATP-binding protein [Clostridia bacterium]|nr:ABC transporter ATP-binding protein [Clostridia bacterium]